MYYNSNFGGQVQQPMPQQMPMYGQGPYPVMDNRLSALEMQMKQGQQNPNLYGGRQQPQQMQVPTQQQFIKAIPVTSFDEAKAARIALDGSMSVFVNIQDGEIYTKQLSMNGLAELKTYKLVNPQENKIEYVTSNDFNGLNQRVQNIENFLNQLGGQQNESNANDASIQPTPANAKSSNGNAAHVRK